MAITGSSVIQCSACGAQNRVQAGREGARCGSCRARLPDAFTGPIELTDANFRHEVLERDLPVLVDLWAPWCGPCRMLAPTIEAVAKRHAGKLLVGKLNTEQHQAVARQLGVTGIPTLVVFKDGRPIGRQTGVMPLPALEAWLQQLGVA